MGIHVRGPWSIWNGSLIGGHCLGETILDPFCGSGTIPLAAHRHRRHSIGIEIDPLYAALARERIGFRSASAGAYRR